MTEKNQIQRPAPYYQPVNLNFIPYENNLPYSNFRQYNNYYYNAYQLKRTGKRKNGYGSQNQQNQSYNRSQQQAKKPKINQNEQRLNKEACPWSEEAKEEERQKKVSDTASKLKSKLMMWNAERSENTKSKTTVENSSQVPVTGSIGNQSMTNTLHQGKGKKKSKNCKKKGKKSNKKSVINLTKKLNSVKNKAEVRQKKIQENLIGELISMPKENLNKVLLNPNVHPKIGIGMAQIVKENRLLLAQKFRKLAESKMNNNGQVVCSQILDDIGALINPDLAIDVSQLPPDFIRQMGDIFQLSFEGAQIATSADQECDEAPTQTHNEMSALTNSTVKCEESIRLDECDPSTSCDAATTAVQTENERNNCTDYRSEVKIDLDDASCDVIYIDHENPSPKGYTLDTDCSRDNRVELDAGSRSCRIRCVGNDFLFHGDKLDRDKKVTDNVVASRDRVDVAIGTRELNEVVSPIFSTTGTQTCDMSRSLSSASSNTIPFSNDLTLTVIEGQKNRGNTRCVNSWQVGTFNSGNSYSSCRRDECSDRRNPAPYETMTPYNNGSISIDTQTDINLIEVEKNESLFGNTNSRDTVNEIMNEINLIDSLTHSLNRRRFYLFLKLTQLPVTSSIGNSLMDRLIRAVTHNDERVISEFANKTMKRK